MKYIEVVAAICERDGKIYATQRGYGAYKGWWEFPGGKIEPGETKEVALRREIREELNADIDIQDFLCTVEHDYPKFHVTMHCFICSFRTDNITLLEHTDARWLSPDDFDTIKWLDADIAVLVAIRKRLTSATGK